MLTHSWVLGDKCQKLTMSTTKTYQRHEYVTTARYGVKKYRPEGIVTIVSNPAV